MGYIQPLVENWPAYTGELGLVAVNCAGKSTYIQILIECRYSACDLAISSVSQYKYAILPQSNLKRVKEISEISYGKPALIRRYVSQKTKRLQSEATMQIHDSSSAEVKIKPSAVTTHFLRCLSNV